MVGAIWIDSSKIIAYKIRTTVRQSLLEDDYILYMLIETREEEICQNDCGLYTTRSKRKVDKVLTTNRDKSKLQSLLDELLINLGD